MVRQLGTTPRPNNAERGTPRWDGLAIGRLDAYGGGLEDGVHVSRQSVAAGNVYAPADRLPECAVRGLKEGNLWHVIPTELKLPRCQTVRARTSVEACVEFDVEKEHVLAVNKAQHSGKHATTDADRAC